MAIRSSRTVSMLPELCPLLLPELPSPVSLAAPSVLGWWRAATVAAPVACAGLATSTRVGDSGPERSVAGLDRLQGVPELIVIDASTSGRMRLSGAPRLLDGVPCAPPDVAGLLGGCQRRACPVGVGASAAACQCCLSAWSGLCGVRLLDAVAARRWCQLVSPALMEGSGASPLSPSPLRRCHHRLSDAVTIASPTLFMFLAPWGRRLGAAGAWAPRKPNT